MDDLTRARIAAILGNLSASLSQLAEAQSMGVADWSADVTVEKPWATIILQDGTRVRITVEVEDVSDPIATLRGSRDPNDEIGTPGGGFDASGEVEWH